MWLRVGLAGLIMIMSMTGASAASDLAGGILWKPRQVRYPVLPDEVQPMAPFVPAGAGEARGPIHIGPGRAAALWVDALDVVRVRRVDRAAEQSATSHGQRREQTAGTLALARVLGADAGVSGQSRSIIEEPGIAGPPGIWYIAQSPAQGDVWVISAPQPMTVIVEYPVQNGELARWEAVRTALLRWVDEDGELPALPMVDGSAELVLGLHADRAIGRAILQGAGHESSHEPGRRAGKLGSAVRAWRKASALVRLAAVGSRTQPSHLHIPLTSELAEQRGGQKSGQKSGETSGQIEPTVLAHTNGTDIEPRGGRPYAPIDADRATWRIELDSPGALELEVRARLTDSERQGETRELEIQAAGRVLAHEVYDARQTWVRTAASEPDAAFPERTLLITPDRAAAGPEQRLLVPLLRGKHTYTIEVRGGPVLIRARVVERRPRLKESLLGQASADDWIAVAERALAGETSPAAQVLFVLLGNLTGAQSGKQGSRPMQDKTQGALTPLLRLVADIEALRGRPVAQAQASELLARALWLTDSGSPNVDPALGWMLRRDLARIAARGGEPGQIAALAGKGQDAPPVILATLAALRADSDPAPEAVPWALATVHAAWQRAPLDPTVRRLYRRLWRRQAAWSRLAPVPVPGNPAEPDASTSGTNAPRYMVITPVAAQATAREPGSLSPGELWRIERGVRHELLAPPSRFDSRRPALLRVYVTTPAAAQGAIALRVDEQTFHAVPLAPVEILTIALAPGTHDVELDGPPGTEAFLTLGPARPEVARSMQRARIRSVPAAGQRSLRYDLPASHRGVPVRLTLRAIVRGAHADQGKRPVRVALHTDAGPARTIHFDASKVDPSLIAMHGAPPVSAPAEAIVWLPPDATRLWLETDPGVNLLAWVAIRGPSKTRAAGTVMPAAPASVETAAAAGSADAPETAAGATEPATVAGTQGDAAEPAAHDDTRTPAPGDAQWQALADEISALSRQLASRPDDPALLIRRANRLLDLGEGWKARADLARLDALGSARLSAAQIQARSELESRLEAWNAAGHLPVQPQELTRPLVLAPASLALASRADDVMPWAGPAQVVRRTGERTPIYQAAQAARERDSLLARYYLADMLRIQGEHWQAGRALQELYEDTEVPAVGLEALRELEAALSATSPTVPAGAASLAYGLALDVRAQLAHPVIDRILLATAQQSRWEPVRNTDANAGFERLYLVQGELDGSPAAQLKQSLVAAPWPSEDTQIVEPGRGALLDVELARPAIIRPQVWCRRIRPVEPGTPAQAAAQSCAVRWRVDNRAESAAAVPLSKETTLGTANLRAGKHQIEVSLGKGDDSLLLAVRFVADRALYGNGGNGANAGNAPANDKAAPGSAGIPVRRPGRLHVASAERPVIITVLGPTALQIEARRYDDQPPVTVAVEAVAESAAAADPPARSRQRSLRIDTPRDDAATSDVERQIYLSRPVATVLTLPESAPYRVTIRPQSGQALVRVNRREDVPAEPQPAPLASSPADITNAPPQPGLQPAVAALPESPPRQGPDLTLDQNSLHGSLWQPRSAAAWPTISVGLLARRDDLEERDDSAAPLENRLQLDLAWRRELVERKLWVRIQPSLRWNPVNSPAYGVSGDLELRRLPLGLGVDLSARWFGQTVEGVSGSALHGHARVLRSFRLQPSLTLLPALGMRARSYSLSPTDIPPDNTFDPLVYNGFDRVHRYVLQPEAKLYWWAFQDQVAIASADLMTNESLRTLDHMRFGLAWRGIIEWQRIREPIFQLDYRPSYRLLDEHRSQGYLRHDLGLGLEWSLWNGTAGRWVFELGDRVYLSTFTANRNVFWIGIRYDATGGRGLRDLLPSERRFTDLIEDRP